VTPPQWHRYLTEFSDAFFAKAAGSHLWGLDGRQIAARWLGFAAASERDLGMTEERLGVRLPPSLRGFLLTTDGWSRPADWVERVCPCRDIQWFRATPAGIPFIEEAARELPAGPENVRFLALLRRMLTVADGDDVWLLDTGAPAADGEYPAYPLTLKYGVFLGHYPSFAALFAAGRSEVEESVG
jgi:SMI1/KNR4 family protein SUKH-1